jgi:hypothetical protein
VRSGPARAQQSPSVKARMSDWKALGRAGCIREAGAGFHSMTDEEEPLRRAERGGSFSQVWEGECTVMSTGGRRSGTTRASQSRTSRCTRLFSMAGTRLRETGACARRSSEEDSEEPVVYGVRGGLPAVAAEGANHDIR